MSATAQAAAPAAPTNRLLATCETCATCINRLRMIPRAIVAGYGWLIYDVVQWFQALPEPTTQQAGLLVTLIGISAPVFGFYMQGGVTAGAITAGNANATDRR